MRERLSGNAGFIWGKNRGVNGGILGETGEWLLPLWRTGLLVEFQWQFAARKNFAECQVSL